MKRVTYVFVLLTIALFAFPVITYRNMTWVDGPSGPEPVDMDRCNYDDDYFNTNELECEEIFSIFLVFPSAILFFAWIICGFAIWEGRKVGRQGFFST